MKNIELLAPARDLACGIAVIDCGADAVYIGAPRFGAREAAGNSLSDIAELVSHAHKYWAKVYVTLNTLLYDDEIPSALRMIEQLYDIGIDGLIIQDTGLMECDLPPLPLIASTQMHNDTPEKVAFLEKVGFQRVILARELDLEQISEIRLKTNVELECFVHGALCVCYSGQCYLSYALGGRSGNRGQCAQPCRKKYALTDGQGNRLAADSHWLSLRDLNLSDELAQLISAGITSFKIEGRLKDEAYVKNVVSFYRSKLDIALAELVLKNSSSGISTISFTPDVAKTYNRGYTRYFLHGRGEPVGSTETPKMVGEEIGRVKAVNLRNITLESTVPLHRGDGICFFLANGELSGTVINDVRGSDVYPDRMDEIEAGTIINRNHDHQFLTQVYSSTPERKIAVTLKVSETPEGIVLLAGDEDGNQAEVRYHCEKVLAEKADNARSTMRKQLMKCGGTDFVCTKLDIDLAQSWFFPVQLLNMLRRSLLEKLADVRAANRPVGRGGALINDVPYPERTLAFSGNVLNEKAKTFYRRHGVTDIEPAAESGLDLQGRKVMTTRYCVLHQLGRCLKEGNKSPVLPLNLIDSDGNKLELHIDCARCGMDILLEIWD